MQENLEFLKEQVKLMGLTPSIRTKSPYAEYPDINIFGLDLIRTCYAYPEQYDVFLGDIQVGYLRLRHNNFSVECPDYGKEMVYSTKDSKGDGIFTDEERQRFLTQAVIRILCWITSYEA